MVERRRPSNATHAIAIFRNDSRVYDRMYHQHAFKLLFFVGTHTSHAKDDNGVLYVI